MQITRNVEDAQPDAEWKNYIRPEKINRQITTDIECNYNRFISAIVSIRFSELKTKLPVTKISTPQL